MSHLLFDETRSSVRILRSEILSINGDRQSFGLTYGFRHRRVLIGLSLGDSMV